MATPPTPTIHNGKRTYHTTQSAYILPNDAQEHDRLETTAFRIRSLLDHKIIHSPLNPPAVRSVIDIGCGTGATTDELGFLFPEAKVYGVDLSPVPAIRPQRENIEYIQGDIHDLVAKDGEEWLAAGSFDYVFSRFLMGGITDWKAYISLCVRLAKPGAYIEFQEPDMSPHPLPSSRDAYDIYPQIPTAEVLNSELGSTPPDPQSWRSIWHDLMRSRGLEPRIGAHLVQYLHAVGLEDVAVKRYPLPFGTWKNMSDAQRAMAGVHEAFARDDAPGLIRKLGSAGVMEGEEVERVVGDLDRFVGRFEGNGEFGWVYVVYGRKMGTACYADVE